VAPAVQYRLVHHFLKDGNYQMASRSLEMIIDHSETPQDIKEKAMYNCARVFDEMDLPEAANSMRVQFLELFPDSTGSDKVRAAL
jgi:outer membrane protein assembly factor BamD (BamD/ComL family)